MIGAKLRPLLWIAVYGALAMPLVAQRVSLRIAPPEGDTLRMQLHQRFDMQSDESSGVVTGEMRVWTHAVVMRRTRGYTDLVSVTDSVRIFPANISLRPLLQAQSALWWVR